MILSSGDFINQKLKLYVDSHNTLTLEDSDGGQTPIAQVTSDEWHFVSLRFDGTNMVVNYDELVYNTYVVGNEKVVVHNSCNPNGKKDVKHIKIKSMILRLSYLKTQMVWKL